MKMGVLDIYSLDDTENRNVIASLPRGKHIIGRGDLLNVTDKRVSRKHAIIIVSDERITLTSIHQNPCFFRPAKGNALTVIKQNEDNELNDGDQFSLLPETYWFKIKVRSDENESGKRLHNYDDINTSPKKAKLDSDTSCSPSKQSNEESKVPNEENKLDTSQHDLNQTKSSDDMEIQDKDKSNISDELNHTSENAELELTNNRVTNNEENLAEAVNITQEDILGDVKNENESEEKEIKEEPIEGDISSGEAQNNATTSHDGNTDQQPDVRVEVKTENDDSTAAGDQNKPKQRRERCWYGDRCFRKNPNHRESFSHPGDQDYPSDPEDDRPVCPYGAACYRTNLDHRREYKHAAKPAPKPSNVTFRMGCPHCDHCRLNDKPGYESDVDDDY